jgi:tricorn protease
MRLWVSVLVLVSLSCRASAADADGEARLLRFPTIHGKHLAFTYAGDLYTVDSTGGIARRITSNEGYEMFAHYSPDGKHLAFTGQYDGNTEIYVMPAEGGVPKRLTFTATLGRDEVSDRMGPNNIVLGWTPDGKHILFRSRMESFNDFIGKIYKVPLMGGIPEELPLPRGGFCSYSPDGKKLAFNRVFREFRTWKRYRGGMADDVWVYDFETKTTSNLTNTPEQEVFPMWHGERIYFLSDRGATARMNLYSTSGNGKDLKQHTDFKDFDIKFPSLGDTAIVFEYGGWIYRYDFDTEKTKKVSIRILEDRDLSRPKLTPLADKVSNFEISSDGSRALFGARGEVLTVPARTGATRNLTQSSGVHERNSKWSPDGKWIAYVSDASGEDEIWVTSPDGSGKPRQLTKDGDTYKYGISWSPDSKHILWTDKNNRVAYVNMQSGATTVAAKLPVWETHDAAWSPDGKWIAWSQEEPADLNRIYLYSLETKKQTPVTETMYSSSHPVFSGDGKYLFFVSQRDFNPTFGQTEWNHIYQDMSRIYLILLAKDAPSPFRPKGETEEKKPDEKKADEKKGLPTVKIDLDSIETRILQLPVPASGYQHLQSVGGTVYYIRHSSKDSRGSFHLFDVAAKKETGLGSVGGYEISADGKKMIVSQDGKYGIIDLPKSTVSIGEALNLSGMEMQLDRQAEWRQIFHECWRQMRDFFYDPALHGVDWKGVRAKYEPLVKHVNHRADLTYIIGEMIAELNAGHAYVGGGDAPSAKKVPLGLLGAKLKKDPDSGFFQIVRIYMGARWSPELRSPLAEIGVDAKAGEFIVAVDGKSTKEMTNIYEALVNRSGKEVTLRLNAEASDKGGRTVTVVPIGSEAELLYHEWVENNLARVTAATDGKIGYLHIPDMQAKGLNAFSRYFYPQVRKKGLIIDVRGNGGGNVSPQIIERLRREAVMITVARNGIPRTDPAAMVYGPKVCLMNEFSASDGDIFPYRFRAHGLGKLIGKRSWGGVVGIRGSLPLTDGGMLNRPEFSRYDIGGKEWVIEGHGVDPDIVVDNDPAREFAGQLERAIAEVMKELKEKEKDVPVPPPAVKK